MFLLRLLPIGSILLGFGAYASAQQIDPAIVQQISLIRVIDNHAHPMLAPPQEATDRDFDALPVDSMEPGTDPVAWRSDSPQLGDAWKALYGFDEPPPLNAAASQRLEGARNRVKQREGEHYPAWVLDQCGIDTMLANRVTLGVGVQPPRFRWVPYADPLLFPLDNSHLANLNPDRKLFFGLEDKLRASYLQQVGLSAIPATLDEYLKRVVTPTLERQKAGGAVAEKFEVAYLRSLDFTDPPRAQIEKTYSRWSARGRPSDADYKLLQDFLLRYIAMECGRLGMAMHLHVMSGGGSYFSISGANPLLLEPLFNDRRLRKTRFVMLHGGWPFVREAGAMLQKPNVYLDISQQSLTIMPRDQALWLREWLELYPDKVLYGSDGYPYSAGLGWAESTWLANRNARRALGIALTGMVDDKEITLSRAGEIARMVLRGNAELLYQ